MRKAKEWTRGFVAGIAVITLGFALGIFVPMLTGLIWLVFFIGAVLGLLQTKTSKPFYAGSVVGCVLGLVLVATVIRLLPKIL